MNEFFGVLIGFLLWSLMGYVFSWYLLKLYDECRLPNDEMSEKIDRESHRKYNSWLRIKYALGSGFIIGGFWFMAIHHNPLISN